MQVPTEFDDDIGNDEIRAVDRAGSDMTRYVRSQETLDDLFSPFREVLAGTNRRTNSASYPVPVSPSDPLETLMSEDDDGGLQKMFKVESYPRKRDYFAIARATGWEGK